MAKTLSVLDLDWIEYLIGKADKNDLHPENKAKLARQRQARQDALDRGEMPLKPFDGGIVLGDEE